MSAKSELISKLKKKKIAREAYVRAKISVNLPSQIRALRLKQKMKQEDLAREAAMKQPRISAMERPGATKFNLETLIRLAAAFNVGLIVKFAQFSEMLRWENEFSQDTFNVATIEDDIEFQREEVEQPSELTAVNMQKIISAATGTSLGTPTSVVGVSEKNAATRHWFPTGSLGYTPTNQFGTNQPKLLGEEGEREGFLGMIKRIPARTLKFVNLSPSAAGSQTMPIPAHH